VAERKIDRAAWAAEIERLLMEEAEGNKTALGAAIGVDRKTVNRWLDQDVDVSHESVRAVARAFKASPLDLLIKVGYDFGSESRPPIDPGAVPESDTVGQLIKSAKVPPSVKRDLLGYVAERRADFERQLRAEIERLIAAEQRGRRTA
jgi:hypothetical protein